MTPARRTLPALILAALDVSGGTFTTVSGLPRAATVGMRVAITPVPQ